MTGCPGRGSKRLAAARSVGWRVRYWAVGVALASLALPAARGQSEQSMPDLLQLLSQVLSNRQMPPELMPVEESQPTEQPAPEQERPEGQGTVGISPTGLLDLHVRDMSVATVLELISYEAQANIVTSRTVNGQVSANLYGVTLEQALMALLTPNGLAYTDLATTIFVGTPEEIAALGPPPESRVFQLRYIDAQEAAAAVKAVLTQSATVVEGGKLEAQSGGGGSSGSGETQDELGVASANYLIITDLPANLDAAAALLREVDSRPRQVLIEATILRATLNESNQFGVDFTMLGGVDFQDVSSTSNAAADLQTGPLLPRDFEQTTFNINTDFAGNVADGGFTFGLIDNGVAAFVRALEDITDVVVVANPKIIALNKQDAQVIVGRRDGYLTTTVTETAAVQTVEFLETGTQIRFRPVINLDGTVRLTVHPKDSNGGLTAANLPFEETTEAHADILVEDGHTVLIGGLFRERTVNSKSQIPVLGDIPIIGLGFSFRNDQTIREEVIILLTVHVIKETDAEQEQYQSLLEDVERVRVGMRRGLMGTGRELLAQAYYHEALRQLEAGDIEKALYNVRATLNNQPKHIAAVKLQERLIGQRIWNDEGTRMRTFIWQLIGDDKPQGDWRRPPMYGRPPLPALRDAPTRVPPPPDTQPAETP